MTVRRFGVATVSCPACGNLNGVRISVQSYDQNALYQCYKCEGIARIELHQVMVAIKVPHYPQLQRGVKVFGSGTLTSDA